VHFANRAIGILAVDDMDRVLLVGQHRYPHGTYSWEIPEGGGGPDESRSRRPGVSWPKRPGSGRRRGESSDGQRSRTR
jgi:hypothetical protein